MHWVVCYDITSNRVRTQVAKRLMREAVRVQKSVFILEADPATVKNLIKSLSGGLDLKTDAICSWPLRLNWQATQVCYPDHTQLVDRAFLFL